MFLKLFTERLDYGTEVEELLQKGMFPIIPSMMYDLGYSEDNVIAFHMTNEKDIPSNISKKAQLSCFRNPSLELTKLPSFPNIILKVKGRMLIKGSSDIYTFIDKNGRRWIKLDASNSTKDSKKLLAKMKLLSKSKSMFEYYKELLEYLNDGGYKLLNSHLKNITYNYDELVMDKIQILGYYTLNSNKKNIKLKYFGDLTTKEFLKL